MTEHIRGDYYEYVKIGTDKHGHDKLKYYPPCGGAVPNRGTRNENWLNIRTTGDKWQGMLGSDGAFVIFKNKVYGIRAALIILKNYMKRGVKSIEQIVSTWAPAKDGNNTPAYIQFVETEVGIGKDIPLDMSNKDVMYKLVRAMGIKETSQKISRNLFDQAVDIM